MDAADVMVTLALSLDDRAELDLLKEGLAAEGWHRAHFSDLTANWASCIRWLGELEYAVEEYLADLTARDAIELTHARASEGLRPRLVEVIAPIDSTFLQMTVEDRDELLVHRLSTSARFRVVVESNPRDAVRLTWQYPNSFTSPLVFGVLPVTIAFAIWPGLFVIQLGL